jgi:hypothetical protein
MRPVLSIFAGLISAFLLVLAIDRLFHALAPITSAMPTDAHDPEAMKAYFAQLPAMLLAGVAIGWAIGAFLGFTISTRLGKRGAWPGWAHGALFLAAITANFVMVRHPTWMVIVAVVGVALATWLGTIAGQCNNGAKSTILGA